MADEVVKTIENVDRLFSEIVVNGESHVSENYVPPVHIEQVVPQSTQEEETPSNNHVRETQGADVYAIELNSVQHDISDRALTQSVRTIQDMIPSQASSENQLADKNFVNSSIATNTANFLGTYTSLAEIEALPNPTNNDYAFLETTDSAGNTLYDRYKYSGETEEWLFEYELNNSGFTAEQWATINSGITQVSDTVVSGDDNPVSSDAVYQALQNMATEMPVYPTLQDAEADLANLEENDFVATEQGGDGITDAVTSGDARAVTSNAVYESLQYDLLWENPNPTADFVAQTITAQSLGVSLSKYKSVKIYAKNVKAGGIYSFQEAPKGLDVNLTVVASTFIFRKVTFTNNGIQFYDGRNVSSYNGSDTVANGAVIPIKIYGVE